MTDVKLLGIAIDEVVKAAERYEYIRILNAKQFADLFKRNIAGEGRFDDLVDAAIKDRK